MTMKEIQKQVRCSVGILILLIFSSSCVQKENQRAQYTISKAMELSKASVTDYITITDSIQLETNQESLIGIVSKIQFTKDRIYILDNYITNCVFIFDLQGNFIKKFGEIGSGPGEYLSINDFVIQEDKQQALLLVEGRRIIFTDLDGNYIKSQLLDFPHISYLFPIRDKYVLGNHVTSGDPYLLHFTDHQFKEIDQDLSIHPNYMKVARTTLLGYTGYHDNYLFAPILSPIIYSVNKEGCSPKYRFDFEEQLLLTEKKIASLEKEDEKQIVENTKSFFGLKSFFDLEDRLFVTFFLNREEYWGEYDFKTETLKYVNQNKMSVGMDGISPKNMYFLAQINQNTLIGVLNDPKRDTEELNPTILIIQIGK